MGIDEMTAEQAAFFKFLRDECTGCGSERLSWVPAEVLSEEVHEPQWSDEQRATFQEMLDDGWGRLGAFVWLCGDCGHVGAAAGGVL